MLKRLLAVAVVAAWALPSSSVAQNGEPGGGKPNYNVGDRNERICEKITPVGSRLTTKRFCGTRAEWEEKRRLDREEVEKAQRGPCVRHAGC
jgi:hypothetical protein